LIDFVAILVSMSPGTGLGGGGQIGRGCANLQAQGSNGRAGHRPDQ